MQSKGSVNDDKNIEDENKAFSIILINDSPKFDQSLKTELEKLVLIILSNIGKITIKFSRQGNYMLKTSHSSKRMTLLFRNISYLKR